ncbi:MAG: hypothetical protein ACREHG_05585 [Candidatus Saccharimonadales bacterium]
MAKSKKNRESGKVPPRQMPAYPVVNDPANHPATNLPTPAGGAYDGDVSPMEMLARLRDFDNDDYNNQ